MFSGTRSKSLISPTGTVIIAEGNNVLSGIRRLVLQGFGSCREVLIATSGSNNVLGYPFEIFDFANG